jgi:hypothetical protein
MTKPVTHSEFSAKLKEYRDVELAKAIRQRQGTVVREVYKRFVERTPVLTSYARSNWQINVGSSASFTESEASGPMQTGASMTSNEESKIKSVLSRLDGLPLGQTVWISNGVPYMKFLEGGSSKKAPAGVVAITLAELELFIGSRD